MNHDSFRPAPLALLAAVSALALPLFIHAADDLSPSIRLDDLALRAPAPQPAGEQDIIAAPKPPGRFGAQSSEHWVITGGVAHNFIDAWDLNLRVAYSQFLIDDVEFLFEVGGWYFAQEGDDAIGINPALAFRWHLIHPPERPWTIFTDVGIGILLATDQVPEGGTFFDFTPRVGFGYTRELGNDGTRLIVGASWHHISNARITGDRRNPARDGLLVYGGVMIPF